MNLIILVPTDNWIPKLSSLLQTIIINWMTLNDDKMPQLYRMFKYRMIIKCHKFDQYDCTAAVTQRLSWPLPPAVYMTLDSNVFKISTNQLISDPSNTYKSLWNVHPVQCLAGYYHMTWSYICRWKYKHSVLSLKLRDRQNILEFGQSRVKRLCKRHFIGAT